MFDLELEIRTENDQARCTESPNAPAYISPTEETRKRTLGKREREREREREGGGGWREECGVRGGEGSQETTSLSFGFDSRRVCCLCGAIG